MTYQCEFCKKTFVKESTVAVHMCEPKRRRLEQNQRGVQIGFQAYLEFYKLMNKSGKARTFDDFADSPYYKAFVKFGRYCVDVRAINPARFTEWVLKQNKKLDHWAKDSVYGEYLTEYLRVENVNDALARAIEFGIDWGEKNNAKPEDCLRYGNSNAMAYAVSTGRISPWVIYCSDSGQRFLADLDSTQVAMIWPYIDSEYWGRKFKDYPADYEYARDILQKAGW